MRRPGGTSSRSAFGVGAGFTLDEFALWVHLDDVYWAEQGRASFDAVICSLAFAALVVLGTRPFGLDEPLSIWGTVAVVGGVVGLSAVAFAKGRVLLGVIGLFVPIVALVRRGAPRAARRRHGRIGATTPPSWSAPRRASTPIARLNACAAGSATSSPAGPPRCGHERPAARRASATSGSRSSPRCASAGSSRTPPPTSETTPRPTCAAASPASAPDAETGAHVRVAGRLMLIRRHGGLLFGTLSDQTGSVQVLISRAALGETGFADAEALDRGDWIGVAGTVMTTHTGELTVAATEVRLLARRCGRCPTSTAGWPIPRRGCASATST